MFKGIFGREAVEESDTCAKARKGQPSVAKKCNITEANLHSILYAACLVSFLPFRAV